MKTDLGSKVGLVLCLAALGTGCGREASLEEPLEPSPDSSSSPPPAESAGDVRTGPPEASPVDPSWWQVTPEPAPIRFEVPACLPVAERTGRRFAHPCGVKQFDRQGWLVSARSLDLRGNVVEEIAYQEGAELWRIHHGYDHLGREVKRVRMPGTGRVTDTTRWVYDDSGQLQMLLTDTLHTSYAYNARGALSFVLEVLLKDGTLRWQRFLYGPAGQLTTRMYASQGFCPAGPNSPDPSCGENFHQQFTYHPNGQLHEDEFTGIMTNVFQKKTFDERGRQLADDYVADEAGHHTTWTHDTRDLRVEEVHSSHTPRSDSKRRTRWLYDAADRTGAEHITEDWASRWEEPPITRRTVKLNRSFYACGSGELLFVEQDADEDGTRDGWRELLRDTAGNLRLERYHGSLVQDASLSRVEYDYSCWQ